MVAKEAHILCEVQIVSAAGTGTRVVAADSEDLFHVFLRQGDDEEIYPQQTFNRAGARETALKVLAGDPLVSTAPGTLRILAAAVLVEATAVQNLQLQLGAATATLADAAPPDEAHTTEPDETGADPTGETSERQQRQDRPSE